MTFFSDTPYLDSNTPLQHPLTCTRQAKQLNPATMRVAAATPLHDTSYLGNNTPLRHPLTCTRRPEQPETQ
jgi:hypothetical protein